jgi:hypothetical protein
MMEKPDQLQKVNAPSRSTINLWNHGSGNKSQATNKIAINQNEMEQHTAMFRSMTLFR